MRLASLVRDNGATIGLRTEDGRYRDLGAVDRTLATDVGRMLADPEWQERAQHAAARAPVVSPHGFRPLIPRPPKMLCLGLNDVEHAREGNFPVPDYPAIFGRFASSLIGHGDPMLRPPESEQLDYEVELAVVVGKAGRRIPKDHALDHVAGYTVFNDGTIRNYQRKTPQWTVGKNWHGTGALGPDLVTPDELPAGAAGLELETWVGDERLQDGNTGNMVFSVADTLALVSEAMVLEPGDVIAMGTVRGVGHARRPQRWLKPGETVRARIEQIGEISNPIVDETVD